MGFFLPIYTAIYLSEYYKIFALSNFSLIISALYFLFCPEYNKLLMNIYTIRKDDIVPPAVFHQSL